MSARPLLRPPAWWLSALELRAPLEWGAGWLSFRLRLQKAWPTPDKNTCRSPIILLPGLLSTTWTMQPLATVLRARGYTVLDWGQGWNVGPDLRRIQGLVDTISSAADASGAPVRLLGWSLGGAYALAAAGRVPAAIDRVMTMGAPLSGNPDHTRAAGVLSLLRGTKDIDPRWRDWLEAFPETCPLTSFVALHDGIVHPDASLPGVSPLNEVWGLKGASHLGMAGHPGMQWALCDRLAVPLGSHTPFSPEGWMKRWWTSLSLPAVSP